MSQPVITTLCIGTEHPSIQECIQSKIDYASKHGYTFLQGGPRYYDRKRHLSWSKLIFLLDVCSKLPDDTLVWQSDTDVYITNPELSLETHIVPLLPATKDMLLTKDSYGNITAGSILCRNTPWLRNFLARVHSLTQFTHHAQREDAAIACLISQDSSMMEVIDTPTVMNSYLCGIPGEPLWAPGDFVVHFVGLRDISCMPTLIQQCLSGEIPRIIYK